MIRFIDCQAQTLGSAPYGALSEPGSTLTVVLTGFLTIFIALLGYDLLLGRSLSMRNGTIAAAKVGAVLALATSWPAYQTLVYDLVTDGPALLVSDIGRPANIPGSDGALLQRLDSADRELVQLEVAGVGVGIGDSVPPPPFAGFNAFALGGSRILFLLTAIAGLGAIRIIAGLLLALGPFFIAFLLFDSTRSLFEGWVRVLAGSALATIGVSVALGIQLAFLEPWLVAVLARREAGEDLPSVPTDLLVITCVFAIVVIAILGACTWLARAFRLAPVAANVDNGVRSPVDECRGRQPVSRAGTTADDERTRARAVADMMVSSQRRESAGRALGSASRIAASVSGSATASALIGQTQTSVGRSFPRARPRNSASAGRRDLGKI
jgi:type IV secretion system protein VirB6